jgi:transposase
MKNKSNLQKQNIEKYREKIFKSKEKCRKDFSKLPFDEKIKISFGLAEMVKYLKNFKKVD